MVTNGTNSTELFVCIYEVVLPTEPITRTKVILIVMDLEVVTLKLVVLEEHARSFFFADTVRKDCFLLTTTAMDCVATLELIGAASALKRSYVDVSTSLERIFDASFFLTTIAFLMVLAFIGIVSDLATAGNRKVGIAKVGIAVRLVVGIGTPLATIVDKVVDDAVAIVVVSSTEITGMVIKQVTMVVDDADADVADAVFKQLINVLNITHNVAFQVDDNRNLKSIRFLNK